MSAIATKSLWKVTLTEGHFSELREGEWLFTSERAAKAFVHVAERVIAPRYLDVEITEIDAYKTSVAALFQSWPFYELKHAAESR